MKRWALIILVLLLPLLPWIIQSGNYFYNINSEYSDLAVSHLPNATYLLRSLRESGEIPLWSNLILSGAPFAADPLSGLWYLPGWLAYGLPQPTGFNLVLLLHVLWGGLGMVWLLSRLGLRREAALMGGIAFELMPKLFAHAAAGHITLVYAVNWTPWLFLAELYRQQQPGKSGFTAAFLPGLVMGVIFLADPRWAAYAAGAWVLWGLWQALRANSWNHLLRWLPDGGLQALLALGVSAVLWLPLAQFTQLSTRSNLTGTDVLTLSLPPAQLAALIFPNIGGYAEWVVYPGAAVVLLTIYAVIVKRVRQQVGFWLVLALTGAVISLGSIWPGAETVAQLPLVDLLRVPSRAWFLVGLSLVVVAAYAFNDLFEMTTRQEKPRWILPMVALTALSVFITAGLALMGGTLPTGMVWAAVAFPLGLALIVLVNQFGVAKSSWAAGLVMLIVADLSGVNLAGMQFRSKCDVLSEGAEAALYLANQEGEFRVYSPSYSIPQQTAADLGLELADGVNPMQLASTSRFMEWVSGVASNGYSVTIPAFASGDPKVDNAGAMPDTELLGLLNVKYVVSEFALTDVRLREVWQAGSTHIYENPDVKPRVWVQPADDVVGAGSILEGRIILNQPNQLKVEVDGPGLVVFSMVDYPGWSLTVDGKSTKKLRIANLLIGVEVGGGLHEVDLTFKSPLLTLGQMISILTWWIALGFGYISFRKSRRGSQNDQP
ncbi:MAG: YfhO family protein [Bellilinea sp.]